MNSFFNRLNNYKSGGIRLIGGFILLCFVIESATSQNNIWFSNKPPEDDKRSTPSGMHGLSSVKGKRGSSSIVQWLREGTHPISSKYIQLTDNDVFEFYLYSPTGKDSVGEFKGDYLTYASKEEGYYNGYLILKHVSNDTLYVNIAKAEMLNHSCRNGHKNVQNKKGTDVYPSTIPAEIIRERTLSENFHYFASSGDVIDYQFVVDGKPIKGADLIFNTQTGWQKKLITNEDGISSFQILQDYFSPWQEINNRKVYDYVIFGNITIPKTGTYNGHNYSFVNYTTSLSDGYRPAKTMYMSMFWALVVFMITVILSVAGIFIYKLNRNKKYKEVSFDEKG
ncbi:MAG: hypothetical protein QM503_11600 [Bacteroidota bacterium]